MIEVAVSLALLSICIICAFSIVKNLVNSNEDRRIRDVVDLSLYAICSEVKYNVSFKEIKNEIKYKKLVINFDDNLLETLSSRPLLSMDRDGKDNEKIEIELKEDKEDYMIINIRIKFKGIEEEQSILKADWMDYV